MIESRRDKSGDASPIAEGQEEKKDQRLKSKKWSVSHPVTGQAQFSGIIPGAGLHTRQLLLLI
jgi:hypothetical protein